MGIVWGYCGDIFVYTLGFCLGWFFISLQVFAVCVEGSWRVGAGAPVVGPFRFDWEVFRSDAYEFFRAFSR